MNSADTKRVMKAFRLLTPEEQRILMEMVEGRKSAKPAAEVQEQRVKALREWNRLLRRGQRR